MLPALLAYLAAQVVISLWAASRIRTEDDFLVAGRSLGYPLLIFTVFASWFGAESVIASAARTHESGFSLSTAEPFGYGLCLILMGLIFAAPLWRRGLTTFADLFRQRYSPGVERAAALLMIPSSIFWAAAQLRGFGHVLTSVVPLGTTTAIVAAAAFCVLYTIFGGLLGDAITDLVQGLVIILGLAALSVAVVLRQGGWSPVMAALDGPPRAAEGPAPGALAVMEEWAIPVIGSIVAVEMVSRVIAARSPAIARNGTMVAGVFYIAIGLLPIFIGLAAAGLLPAGDYGEEFLPSLARTILPPAMYVVLAGALISAILSTVNTILLVSAGLLSHNLIAPALKLTSDKAKLALVRGGIVALGIVGAVLALGAEGIGALVEEASAFGSAGIVVITTFGLFTTRGGPRAAMLTLWGGLGVYLAAAWGGAPYPFLSSLAAALLLYLGAAALESRQNSRAVTGG